MANRISGFTPITELTGEQWIEVIHRLDPESTWQHGRIDPAFLKGQTGDTGDAGASAYDVAVDNGFVGSEAEWLASLEGPQGDQGIQGDQGEQGIQGDAGSSAYQVAVDQGFVGTEQEWLDSLVGEAGKSVYELYQEANPDYTGTQEEFLASLQGTHWHALTDAPATDLGAVGDFAINTTTTEWYQKTGEAQWDSLGTLSSGVDEAPQDGTPYQRQDGAWVAGIPEAPLDGKMYGRVNGEWVEIVLNSEGEGPAGWDGIIYLADDWGVLEAVNMQTETQVWVNKTDNYAESWYHMASNATHLFALDTNAKVWVFDKTDGSLTTSVETNLGWAMGIAADSAGNFYVTTSDTGDITKFDQAGTVLWTFTMADDPNTGWTDGGVRVRLTSDEAYLYAASSVDDNPAVDHLFKLDASDGSQVWAVAGPSGFIMSMAVGPDDSVYVGISGDNSGGSNQDGMRKYDNAGNLLWTALMGANFSGDAYTAVNDAGTAYTVVNQNLASGTDNTRLLVVDTDGNLVDDTQEVVTLSGIATQGTAVFVLEHGTEHKEVVMRDANDWSELARFAPMDGANSRYIRAITL